METNEPEDRMASQAFPAAGGCPVIGIGGSAGGIEALKLFFSSVSPHCDFAFVVVQHLDPDHKSALVELLARACPLPVTAIEEGTSIEPNRVYVIPPNATVTILSDKLHLSQPLEHHGHRTPIDTFFLSLAAAKGEYAACVILSGTGSDGTLGLRAIKENGGLALAQASAQYDGMMRSAVSTGLVDYIVRADEMPSKIADFFRHLRETDGLKGSDGLRREAADHLPQICAILRARTGHDFSGYKDKTMVRRVQRRMQVLQIEAIPDFLKRLREDQQQVNLLFQDLLIGVTSFFRDPTVFDALRTDVIPEIFAKKRSDDTIRVWVPGCASGEEAYSLAILLREHMRKSEHAPQLQIFASDIDEQALEVARIGRYPASIATDVPAQLLERSFLREDGTYRVVSDLREICLFSRHNLLRDAPFSRLDLLSCRNLLIYLNADLQNRIVPLFHYALRDGGYLVLGSSENVTRHMRLFSTVNKNAHIYRRRPQTETRLPDFPLIASDVINRDLVHGSPPASAAESVKALAERALLDRHAPAYVVVNDQGELIYSSARTGKYLELPAGAPNSNIFNLARRGMRLELRALVRNVLHDGAPSQQKRVTIGVNGGRQITNLVVQALRRKPGEDPLCLVVFHDVGDLQREGEDEVKPGQSEDLESVTVQRLDVELRETRERLHTVTEELESSNEELKSGNEELSSANEELQSANEELETSKEELQSINEELQTVNAELKSRVDELSRANSDIANLLESTQIATVFLDRNLAVTRFTPAAKDVFRLVESDQGRPISHIRSRLRLDMIEDDAARVLRTLCTIEKQVESSDSNTRYILRMLPYRTVDNMIAGVVITFTDITRVAAAEARINELAQALRERIESLETLLDLVPVGILIAQGADARRVLVNRSGAHLLGDNGDHRGPREISAKYRLFEGSRELALEEQPLQRAARTGDAVPGIEARLELPDGAILDVIVAAIPLFDEHHKPRGAIAALVDISQRKRAELRQAELLQELQHRVKNVLATVASLAERTLKNGSSAEEFSTTFLERLQAMGALHELMSRGEWEGADIHSVAMAVLRPYRNRKGETGNVELKGPEVRLSPTATATLGMALHELATNAAKYGALSVQDGRVELTWETMDAGKRVALRWVERNGPSPAARPAHGFGLNFLTRSIEYGLGGSTLLDFASDGLRARIEFPLVEGASQGGSGQ